MGGDSVYDLAVGVDRLLIDAAVSELSEQLDGVSDHRQQFGHHPVLGAAGDADMETRIPLQVVLSGMDEVFDLSAQLAHTRHILLCGLLGSHRGHPRLHIQPDVQQFAGQPQLVWHVGEAQGVVDHTGVVGNESAPSPADLKHVLGHQQLHGLGTVPRPTFSCWARSNSLGSFSP